MRRRLSRVPVTVVYAALLVVVTVTLAALGPAVHDRVVGYASTNLHNLGAGRIDTLFASALIADDGRFFLWLPGLICLLAVAELLWRSRRLLAVFLVGHIGTTLVVAAGLVAAVELGWLPWSVSRVADVGVSYGVLTVVGALTAVVPARLRAVWLAWWLAGSVAVLAGSDNGAKILEMAQSLTGRTLADAKLCNEIIKSERLAAREKQPVDLADRPWEGQVFAHVDKKIEHLALGRTEFGRGSAGSGGRGPGHC